MPASFINGRRVQCQTPYRPAGTTLRVYISMTGRSNFSATSVSLTYYDSNPMLPGGGVTQARHKADRSLWGLGDTAGHPLMVLSVRAPLCTGGVATGDEPTD